MDEQTAHIIMRDEAKAVSIMADSIPVKNINNAIKLLLECKGNVITSGIGKSGIVAKKIAGTLSSTGMPAFYVHPVDALHGDFGKIKHEDVIIVVSRSGSTKEIVDFTQRCRLVKLCSVIAITAMPGSKLSCIVNNTLCTYQSEEAGPLGLAPSISTTCALVLGDALALSVMKERNLTEENYRANHPSGVVGNG